MAPNIDENRSKKLCNKFTTITQQWSLNLNIECRFILTSTGTMLSPGAEYYANGGTGKVAGEGSTLLPTPPNTLLLSIRILGYTK